jgi:hypothetical protein
VRTYRRRRSLVATAAAVALALMAGAAAFSPARAGTARTAASYGPGCQPGARATAYRPAHPQPLRPQPPTGPVPCLVGTGFGGAETQVAVTKDGTVVYEPAILTPGLAGTGYLAGAPGPHLSTQVSPGGLSLTGDRGRSWSFAAPAGATWVPQDDALYVDRTTGRIFYYALSADPIPASGQVPLQNQLPAGYANLMTSGDDGRTWSETSLPGYIESENPRFTSGPAPAGQTRPANYPDVVYWCGNNIVKVGLNLPSYRACYRSLDGGLTWRFASVLASSPVPQHPQCGPNGETLNDGDPNYPEADPAGSLYVEINCGSSTFLARSVDEGATWPLVTSASGAPVKLPADGELRVGTNGDLFLAYQPSPSIIVLQVSTDGGRSWGRVEQLTPAGIGPVTQWAVAQRGPGLLALSYLVERGSSALYDGYLTFTRDATARQPLLWAAAINPASSPMRTSAPPPARDDFIGAAIGPDGTPWASFAASCPGPVTEAPACAEQTSNPEANEAVAGRLAWAG